jgi:hypothetical protein
MSIKRVKKVAKKPVFFFFHSRREYFLSPHRRKNLICYTVIINVFLNFPKKNILQVKIIVVLLRQQ